MNKEEMIYDLLKEVRSDVKDIKKEFRKEIDELKKQVNLSKGYIIGLSALSGLVFSIIKSMIFK